MTPEERTDALSRAALTPAPRVETWVNEARTILVTLYSDTMTVARRPGPDHVWGPPVSLTREDRP